MSRTAFLLILIFFLRSPVVPADTGLQMAQELDSHRLGAHVNFLAHDLLEGRETGSRGYDVASLYVATQFAQLGLIPAGDAGTFLQHVPLRKATLTVSRCSLTLLLKDREESLQYEKDFLMSDDYLRTETSVMAKVVFAGFGVTAPELKHDDYAKIDANGKIVILLSGAPAHFPTSRRAHYSSTLLKEKNAVAHGAAGILTVRTPVDEKRQPWERTVRQSKLSGFRWLDREGNPNQVFPQIRGTALLSRSGAEKLFEAAGQNLQKTFDRIDQRTLKSFSLGISANLTKFTKHEFIESPNVVGLLPGMDPKLKDEYVVYTAHLDHIGITDPIDGDSINNGAYDNATGIAALIEIARAFTQLPTKPKRSVLFVAVTAEEKGLQGSDYFAHFPTVNASSMVANVNMDMFLMLFPVFDVVILGAEHSSLGPIAIKAAEDIGLKVSPDPAPEEVRFIRSDQYSFIKQGIPAVKLLSGFQSTDPSVQGKEVTLQWLRTIYHSPQDDATQKIHWESGIKMIRTSFLIGYRIADSPLRPKWNPGDFFGTTYATGR